MAELLEMWNDNITLPWGKMLLIGLFFVLCNLGIFVAMCYVRQGVIIECGYPQRNAKYMKKKITKHSFIERLLLIRLTRDAEKKGPILCINLVCHFINILTYIISLVGFVGCMITLADGWALTLACCSSLFGLLITTIFEFVPHLIWVPSEKRRYKFFK